MTLISCVNWNDFVEFLINLENCINRSLNRVFRWVSSEEQTRCVFMIRLWIWFAKWCRRNKLSRVGRRLATDCPARLQVNAHTINWVVSTGNSSFICVPLDTSDCVVRVMTIHRMTKSFMFDFMHVLILHSCSSFRTALNI